jgi:uncharacterized membrane protein
VRPGTLPRVGSRLRRVDDAALEGDLAQRRIRCVAWSILRSSRDRNPDPRRPSVDLTPLFPYLLFLHVLGAILAFGPTFAYSIMGAMAGREPQHANFSARQTAAISNGLVYPLAAIQAVSGILVFISAPRDEFKAGPWLVLGIVLYVVALTFSLTLQRNALHRLIELTATPPAPGTPPSPEIPATVGRIQRGGIFTGVLIVTIVFLMVVKPGV